MTDKNRREEETPTQKVVPFRNEREIARAIGYAEVELRTNIELDTKDSSWVRQILECTLAIIRNIGLGQTSTELTRVIDELVTTTVNLEQSALDLIAGAEAQAVEFGEELERLQVEVATSSVSATFETIEDELDRREKMRDRIADIQEELEDTQSEKRKRVEILKQALKFGGSEDPKKDTVEKEGLESDLEALGRTIASLIEAIAGNDRDVQTLVNYRDALKLVGEGLPNEIIGRTPDLRSTSLLKQ